PAYSSLLLLRRLVAPCSLHSFPTRRSSDLILQERDKRYSATVTLGRTTDTEDATGKTLETEAVPEGSVNKKDVLAVIEQFKGDYSQTVPLYSSVRVNGRKLYWYAHEGIEVERPSRTVRIKHLELTSDLSYE